MTRVVFVAPCRGSRLQLLEERAGPVDLTEPHEETGKSDAAGSHGTRDGRSKRSSISTPRSRRPGVTSARPRIQPGQAVAIAIASSVGSPTRSACSSASACVAQARRRVTHQACEPGPDGTVSALREHRRRPRWSMPRRRHR